MIQRDPVYPVSSSGDILQNCSTHIGRDNDIIDRIHWSVQFLNFICTLLCVYILSSVRFYLMGRFMYPPLTVGSTATVRMQNSSISTRILCVLCYNCIHCPTVSPLFLFLPTDNMFSISKILSLKCYMNVIIQ